jgi:hypothetical protein
MKTLEQVVSKFPPEVSSRYDFSNAVYKGSLERIGPVRCPDHGEFSQYAAQFRKGRGCPQCGAEQRTKSQRMSPDRFFYEVSEKHGGKYTYQNDYVRMADYIYPICPKHGEFRIRALKHYYNGQGCGRCEQEAKKTRILKYRHLSAESKRSNYEAKLYSRCREVHGDRYTYPEQPYPGARGKLRIVCALHGEFEQAVHEHLRGKGCPSCGAYTPRWEADLSGALRIAGFEVVQNARILGNQEIDIYLPERKFGIELHGLRWHTERTRHKNYHHDKWALADSMGIRLIQVFEDEWNNKQDIVLKRIDAMLGRAPTYAARKCTMRVVDSPEAREFMDRTHIQGATRHGAHYGLDYEGRLTAVASFCPKRGGGLTPTGEPDAWEVLRYASEGRVRGGFSRLMKAFVRDHGPEELISYCDLRYGDGGLYRACGFQLDGLSQPDYWWVPDGRVERVPRYKTQKHKLKDIPELALHCQPGMSERQVCQAAGWERIFGVGSQRWIWRSKNAVV